MSAYDPDKDWKIIIPISLQNGAPYNYETYGPTLVDKRFPRLIANEIRTAIQDTVGHLVQQYPHMYGKMVHPVCHHPFMESLHQRDLE